MTIRVLIEQLERLHSPDAQVKFCLLIQKNEVLFVPRGKDHFHYEVIPPKDPYLKMCLEPIYKSKVLQKRKK
jgi:hypothetical protein